ncbi:MAG: hypothetical protein ACI9OJ_004757 [Myxococcota bacterium]|jgi:hypothetical protein
MSYTTLSQLKFMARSLAVALLAFVLVAPMSLTAEAAFIRRGKIKKRATTGYKVIVVVGEDSTNQVNGLSVELLPQKQPQPLKSTVQLAFESFDDVTGEATFTFEPLEFTGDAVGWTYKAAATLLNADGKALGAPIDISLPVEPADAATAVVERLRHKNRGITLWDYERVVEIDDPNDEVVSVYIEIVESLGGPKPKNPGAVAFFAELDADGSKYFSATGTGFGGDAVGFSYVTAATMRNADGKQVGEVFTDTVVVEAADGPAPDDVISANLDDNLTVAGGTMVVITGAAVDGNIKVSSGGTLIVLGGATVTGHIKNHGGILAIGDGSTIMGKVTVDKGGELIADGATFGEDGIKLKKNTGDVTLTNNTIVGDLKASRLAGAFVLSDNVIGGKLDVDRLESITFGGTTSAGQVKVTKVGIASIQGSVTSAGDIDVKTTSDGSIQVNGSVKSGGDVSLKAGGGGLTVPCDLVIEQGLCIFGGRRVLLKSSGAVRLGGAIDSAEGIEVTGVGLRLDVGSTLSARVVKAKSVAVDLLVTGGLGELIINGTVQADGDIEIRNDGAGTTVINGSVHADTGPSGLASELTIMGNGSGAIAGQTGSVGLTRIKFRDVALAGRIPGLTKASWKVYSPGGLVVEADLELTIGGEDGGGTIQIEGGNVSFESFGTTTLTASQLVLAGVPQFKLVSLEDMLITGTIETAGALDFDSGGSITFGKLGGPPVIFDNVAYFRAVDSIGGEATITSTGDIAFISRGPVEVSGALDAGGTIFTCANLDQKTFRKLEPGQELVFPPICKTN